MQHDLTSTPITPVLAAYACSAEEDAALMTACANGVLLAVADGCGGLGSRRIEQHTGAWVASHTVINTLALNASLIHCAESDTETASLAGRLSGLLHEKLKAQLPSVQAKGRIIGSMLKEFPTTVCMALVGKKTNPVFYWCGDSRGYVMNADGLHQCTADHIKSKADAFDSLYTDSPLAKVLSAEEKVQMDHLSVKIQLPYVLILCTDGAYNFLPSPMEFEMFLLDTLYTASSCKSWQAKLVHRFAKQAQDDATLLMLPIGYASFEQMKEQLLDRRRTLQKKYITPTRSRKEYFYTKAKWQQYKQEYIQLGVRDCE